MRTPREELPEHLSWSQIWLYSTCPRLYYYRYIERLETQPLYVLSSGRAIHAGLEAHNLSLARGGAGLSCADIIDIGVADLATLDDIDIGKEKAIAQFQSEAINPVTRYLYWTQREDLGGATPITEDDVEREIWFKVGGSLFLGYVDLVLPDRFVDYKFVGRWKYQTDVDHDGQLAIYGEVLKRPGCFVQLLRRREDVKVAYPSESADVRKKVLLWVDSQVAAIAQSKQTGLFPRCQPSHWKCQAGKCEFFDRCQTPNKPGVTSA